MPDAPEPVPHGRGELVNGAGGEVARAVLHVGPRALDPWSVAGAVRCPVLVLAGEDDPLCPLPVVEELAGRLPAQTTRLVRLPGARHTIFRDRPDLAFPAVRSFASQVRASQPAG